MKITEVDAFYLSMPEVLDIGDGSQDMLLIRVRAGDHTGWGGVRSLAAHLDREPGLPDVAQRVSPGADVRARPAPGRAG
jgi:hypothetical protein